jgi:indole-3-acetate monooxygenase
LVALDIGAIFVAPRGARPPGGGTATRSSATTLDPLIRRHAGSAEHNRVMAPEIMEALVASGLMRMWVPEAYGGLEADTNESLDVMEQLARIDAATGWVVSNCVGNREGDS